MSETARVLRFPRRWQPPLSQSEASESARAFLEKESVKRSSDETDRVLSDPDTLSALCKLLTEAWHSNPKLVAERASALYHWLNARESKSGLFDEDDYFLGEAARLAAGAYRLLGNRDEAESWLQRAEAGFRHTVNPGPLMAQVAYLRLALAYDKRRFQEVLELIPSLLKSFEKFGMCSETVKTHYLEAMALKLSSRRQEAFEKLSLLQSALEQSQDFGLRGQVCVEIGACYANESRYEDAIRSYQKGLGFLSSANRPVAVADLKMAVGETLQLQGALTSAAEAYRDGVQEYAKLEMATAVAYGRLVLAEVLVCLGRHREAEWEILAALPTIEEQKMVPEGFAAVGLLQESVRQRKTDPNALRELRDHLKANG